MSFILDALKKSERDRQRQTSPGLFEVKVAPPRNRFPLWAVVIGALLVINSGVVIWLLLNNSSKGAESQTASSGGAASTGSRVGPAPNGSANQGQWNGGPTNSGPPPYGQPAGASQQYPGTPYGTNPNAPPPEGAVEYFGDSSGASQDEPAKEASNEPRLKRNSPDDDVLNPDDYEPAQEAPRTARSTSTRKPRPEAAETNSEESPADRAARKAEKGLPSYQDAAALPGINMPPLRLDLHVFDPEPDKSFVMVNMQKVKAGDTLAQGVHVDQITPTGAIMSYRGVRFLLHSE